MQNHVSIAGSVRRWLAPPIFVEDEDKTRIAGVFNTLILSAISIWFTTTIVQILLHVQNSRNVPITLVTCAVLLGVREAARRGYVSTAVILFCSILLLAFVMVAYNNGTVRAMGTAAMMVCVIVPTLLIGTRIGLIFVGLASAFVFGLSQAELAGALPSLMSNSLVPTSQWIIFTAIILFHWALVGAARNSMVEALARAREENRLRQRAEESLRELNASLEKRVEERTIELQQEILQREQSEARLQAIIDNYPFQVFVKTVPDARYILGNHAWREMYGVSTLHGQSDHDLFPEAVEQLRREDLHIIETGKPQTYERMPHLPNGQRQFHLTTKFPLYNSDRTAYAIGGVSTDITQLKEAEQARAHAEVELQTALKRTRVLYDVTRTGIASWNLEALLQEIVRLVAQGLPANRASLVTLDLQTKKIENFVRGGRGADQVLLSVSYNELMDGLSGWVIRTGQSALSPKNIPDPRESQAVQKRRADTNCGSILVTSLQYQGQKLGTLTAINLPEEPDFSESDVELLEAIASQTASVIIKITLEENLHRSNERLAFLHQITLNLLQQDNMDDLVQTITDEAAQLLNADGGYLALVEGKMLVDRAVSPKNAPYRKTTSNLAEDQSIVKQVIDSRETIVVANLSSHPNVSPQTAAMGVKGAILLPLLTTDACQGVLGAGRVRTDQPFTEEDIFLGSLFTRVAGLTLDNTRLRETLRQEAIRDPLTGLFNRRFMQEALTRELSRADRHSLPLIVAMLDLDFFKRINDTFGHDAGDDVLRQLGSLLQMRFRGSDIACRYGGEEFTLILPEVSLSDALTRMEELREAIRRIALQHQEKKIPQVTVSIGLAQYPDRGLNGETLLKAADEALYRAKENGRDRIVFA